MSGCGHCLHPSSTSSEVGSLARQEVERLRLHCSGPVEPGAPEMIVAMMIGELRYQPELNSITTQIVGTAVKVWQSFRSATLVCEAAPMASLASRLGVPTTHLAIAIPGSGGHTTRKVAEWLRARLALPSCGSLWVITHVLHADRARRILERCRIQAACFGLDIPFPPRDLDWKLRSALRFRLYNLGAEVYCQSKGWL